MSKYFLSFGNERFIKSRERIKKEARSLTQNEKELFDNYIIETQDIINEKEFKCVIDKIPKTLGTGRGVLLVYVETIYNI